MLTDSVHRDALTNIGNRRMFDAHIERLWNQAIRTRAPIALLLVDLDHFKSFNDHAGHQAGDTCLASVAGAIAQSARRPLDVAARYGGEEFVVLLFDVKRERVEELCRELHANVAALQIVTSGLVRRRIRDGQHRCGLRRAADGSASRRPDPARRRSAVRREGRRPQSHGRDGSRIRDAEAPALSACRAPGHATKRPENGSSGGLFQGVTLSGSSPPRV